MQDNILPSWKISSIMDTQERYLLKLPQIPACGTFCTMVYITPSKKIDKIRVVFDCSAKYRRESLPMNTSYSLDLINNLVDILCCFQKHPVAVLCDIQSMFHQFFMNSQIEFSRSRDHTCPEQWNYALNKMDSPVCTSSTELYDVNSDDHEVGKVVLHTKIKPASSVLTQIQNYSSWRNIVALSQNVAQMRKLLHRRQLSVKGLQAAQVLVRLTKEAAFPAEIDCEVFLQHCCTWSILWHGRNSCRRRLEEWPLGTDFFSPFYIKEGRRELKRWVVSSLF